MMHTVRRADLSDIPELCLLECECFSSPWSKGAFSESMREDSFLCFVCEIDGGVAGYAGGVCVADECSVTNVAVSEKYRRRGVATSLLDTLESEAAALGVSAVYLEVRVSNEAAIRTYEGRGYVRCGQRRNFYTKPTEDAYVYKKEL